MSKRRKTTDKAGDAAPTIPLRPRRKCPECGAVSDRAFHPFCSRRCADLDLGRWLGGKYRIPDPDGSAPLRYAEEGGDMEPSMPPMGGLPGSTSDRD